MPGPPGRARRPVNAEARGEPRSCATPTEAESVVARRLRRRHVEDHAPKQAPDPVRLLRTNPVDRHLSARGPGEWWWEHQGVVFEIDGGTNCWMISAAIGHFQPGPTLLQFAKNSSISIERTLPGVRRFLAEYVTTAEFTELRERCRALPIARRWKDSPIVTSLNATPTEEAER